MSDERLVAQPRAIFTPPGFALAVNPGTRLIELHQRGVTAHFPRCINVAHLVDFWPAGPNEDDGTLVQMVAGETFEVVESFDDLRDVIAPVRVAPRDGETPDEHQD